MSIVDKRGILSNILDRNPVLLEIGCGNNKRTNEAIGIDILDYDCVDIVGDAMDVLKKIPDNIVDGISSYHFLEHADNLDLLLGEVARVLRLGGLFQVVVPHFSNPYFYSDPTHKNYFGLYTFSYLGNDRIFRRKVPHYKAVSFRLIDVDLLFKSPPPFIIRYGIKKVLGAMFNSCRYMQEFYEENLCYLFPCYEIKYVIEKITPTPKK
jgi:SAM-dependent methyltransferase